MSMAVFLAHDEYDGINQDNSISVTTLLKPTKEIILSHRVPPNTQSADVSGLIASRYGTCIHNGLEAAWLSPKLKQTLQQLGYPKRIYEDVRINPEVVDEDYFNVFIEQRVTKEINGFKVNGKYDLIVDGTVEDLKTTSTYSYIKSVNDRKYELQGGLYRWLNPDKVTEDTMKIHFVFTDWSKLELLKRPKVYPPLRIMTKEFKCMSPTDAHTWLVKKLLELSRYWESPQKDLPICTPKDLWQDDPVYKYYLSGDTTGRATAVCKTPAEADRKRREKGGMGVIIPVYGKPKACKFCKALSLCEQGKSYAINGLIDLEN